MENGMSEEQYMRADQFMHEMSGVSRTLGRNHSAKIVFRGSQAGARHNEIIYPAMPGDQWLSRRTVQVFRGFADHEGLGHMAHTDFNAMLPSMKEAADGGDVMLKRLINGIEDVRIEKIVTNDFAGTKKNLEVTTEVVNNKYLEAHAEDNTIADDFRRVAPIAVTWEGRRRMGYDTDTIEKCLDTLSPDNRAKVEKWCDLIDALCRLKTDDGKGGINGRPGTQDVIDLAKRLCKEERDEHEDDDDDPTITEPWDEGDEGESGQDGPTTRGKGGGGVGADDMERITDQALNPEIDPMLEPKVKDMCDEGESGVAYHPYTTEDDYILTSTELHETHGISRYQATLDEMQGKVNTMQRRLQLMLMAKRKREYTGGHEHGRLNTRELVGAYSGRPNVFKIREDSEDMDTAVSVVVDHSGSMCGREMDTAARASIAIAEALEGTGVAYEITGFNNMGGHYGHSSSVQASRFGAQCLLVYKDFNEPLVHCRGALGTMHQRADGNNADGESVMHAFSRLDRRQEARKIMMVLSDGYPATHSSYGSAHLNEHLRRVVDLIQKSGTEIMGVGIHSDAVQQFYPDWVVLHDIDDLPKLMIDRVGKWLIGERFSADNSTLMNVNRSVA